MDQTELAMIVEDEVDWQGLGIKQAWRQDRKQR
jgi:hypothetical protein